MSQMPEDNNSRKIIILGIGNESKGDDGVGPYIIKRLKIFNKNPNLVLIDAGVVPENYIQKIINFNPETIIIIDYFQAIKKSL